MNDEIKEILDGFDKCLKNYELDKALGQFSVESIYHLFPHKQLLLKDYITNLQQLEQEHQKINGELREENSKLEIALQNIQEDYDRRIEENERLKVIWKDTNVIVKDNKTLVMNTNAYDTLEDYKSRCEQALDKLYCYGEIFDSKILQQFQKEMENILQNGSEEK